MTTDGSEDGSPADGSGWQTDWYRSGVGLGLLGANVLLLLLVVVVSAPPAGNVALPGSYRAATAGALPAVPWFVYVFAAIGGLGYVFTWLLDEFERSVKELVRVSLRVPAALPLGAGVYVVAAQVNGGSLPARFGAALAFLAGLYVNLAYRRLGALADRLLPGETGDGEGSTAENGGSTTEEGTSTGADGASGGEDGASADGEPTPAGGESDGGEPGSLGDDSDDATAGDGRSSVVHSPPVRNEQSSDGAE